MIKTERVTEFPYEVLAIANEHVLMSSPKTLSSLLAMSIDNRYLKDEEGNPLLIVGAFRLNYFSQRVELWMVATKYFGLQHLKECRRLIHEWLAEQNLQVIIRCKEGTPAKFLRVMGFKPKGV
jgi:hypothetical protein